MLKSVAMFYRLRGGKTASTSKKGSNNLSSATWVAKR